MRQHRGDDAQASALDGIGRWVVVAVALAMGVSAVGGGFALLNDAAGFGVQEEWLSGSPFPDYRVPGLFLTVALGGGMTATALLALMRSPFGAYAALAMGALLVVWRAVETLVIGFRGPQQAVLLVVCGMSGAALYLIGRQSLLAGWRARYR